MFNYKNVNVEFFRIFLTFNNVILLKIIHTHGQKVMLINDSFSNKRHFAVKSNRHKSIFENLKLSLNITLT